MRNTKGHYSKKSGFVFLERVYLHYIHSPGKRSEYQKSIHTIIYY